MNHLLDLDGDWFAARPGLRYTASAFSGKTDEMTSLVGDLLANVRKMRAPDGAPVTVYEWADPQFVQVAEVLPIKLWRPVHARDDASSLGGYPFVTITEDGETLHWWHHDAGWRRIDLPGAVPGGWAIRVEPAECPSCDDLPSNQEHLRPLCPLCTRPPVIEGKALNA